MSLLFTFAMDILKISLLTITIQEGYLHFDKNKIESIPENH